MDKKKMESKLSDWACRFGFRLSDGSFPESGYFSPLIATHDRCQLWDMIMNKVESKEKVEKMRKQIFIAKLQNNEADKLPQNFMLNTLNAGIEHKIAMWKKKEQLEKKIAQKKKQIDELHSVIYKKAQLHQSEICELAKVEKCTLELKEKALVSKLLLGKYRRSIKEYKEKLSILKSYRLTKGLPDVKFDNEEILDLCKKLVDEVLQIKMKHDLESEQERELIANSLPPIQDKNTEMMLWKIFVDNKKINLDNLVKKDDCSPVVNVDFVEDDRESVPCSIELMAEKLMIDATENSLEAILNKANKREEAAKLEEILSKIEKFMFNTISTCGAATELSYIAANETGDSLTERSEKMTRLLKSLSYFGMNRRRDYLKQEIDKLSEFIRAMEHWKIEKEKSERKLAETVETEASLRKEVEQLTVLQKASTQSVLKRHAELQCLTSSFSNRITEAHTMGDLTDTSESIEKFMKSNLDLFQKVSLEAFKRIQAEGKELLERESLDHCLDRYGGELKEMFASLLLSPYNQPKLLLESLGRRRELSTFADGIIAKIGNDVKNDEARLLEITDAAVTVKAESMHQNYKDASRNLSKVVLKSKNLDAQKDLVQKILNTWSKQSHRFAVPDSVTVSGLTLRQVEDKYQMIVDERDHFTSRT